MATANFRRMEYNMPLVCGNLTDYDEMAKAYEESTGEEYDDFLYELDQMDEYQRAKSLANTLCGFGAIKISRSTHSRQAFRIIS